MSGMIGRVLEEKYEIIEQIGQGGMAVVFKAKDIRLNRFVAIKILKSEFNENEQFLKKFLREAQSDAKLAHPNIVNVYDVGIENGLYFIVMEYIDGKTLKAYIKSKGQLSAAETAELCLSIAQALSHAHANNIIHRDIKPHNILMTSTKMPKVADFGIARAITSSTITATEEALGSVHYISPEQARGGFLDERSDLYSLGILMYEMMTGELPYDADTPVAVALKHVQNKVPSPSAIDPSIPRNMSQIVLNLTRRKADDRYQDAAELISDLRKIIGNPQVRILPTYYEERPTQLEVVRHQEENDARGYYVETQRSIAPRVRIAVFSVLGATILALVIFFILHDPKIPLPDLTGMTLERAQIELRRLELASSEPVYEVSPDIPDGSVIRHEPEADAKLEKGAKITLYVSKGPQVSLVPNVEGISENDAKAKLAEANFTYDPEIIQVFSDTVEKNLIISQDPKPNTEHVEGTSIKLTVSKGKEMINVPNVKGISEANARDSIAIAGLVLASPIEYQESDKPYGTVIAQNPAAGKSVAKNSRVTLTVSKGERKSSNYDIHLPVYTVDIPEEEPDVEVRIMYGLDKGKASVIFEETREKTETVTVPTSGFAKETYYLFVYINGVDKTPSSSGIPVYF